MESNFFDISELFSVIETAVVSRLQMMLIYIYIAVSVYWSECAVYLCVYVCVISNLSTRKKAYYVSGLSKFDALLYRTHVKVALLLSYQGLTFIDP